MTPDNYATAGVPQLTADDWKQLASGRALLLVHGTFSTAHGAFCGLERKDIEELNAAYGGRVFAFDHPSLSEDPARNAKELSVSHSRRVSRSTSTSSATVAAVSSRASWRSERRRTA